MYATLFKRGVESLRELGAQRSLETVMNHLEDRLFDLANGTDTYAKVVQADLKVDSAHQVEAAPYFPLAAARTARRCTTLRYRRMAHSSILVLAKARS